VDEQTKKTHSSEIKRKSGCLEGKYKKMRAGLTAEESTWLVPAHIHVRSEE